MKTETIDFRNFVKDDWKKKRNLKLYSTGLIAGVSLKSLFDLPPLVANGYITIGVIGVTALSMAFLENRYAKNGKHIEADRVASFGSFIFPLIFGGSLIGFAIYAYRTLLM
jgi:hypothetical protein